MKKVKLKRRITAIFLTAISTMSVATATIPMVSAAQTDTAITTETFDISGKDLYDRAQKELLEFAKESFKGLPGGSYLVEFYQYCISLAGKTLNNKKTDGPSLADIKKQLDELKKYIVEVSSDLKLLKNKNFDDLIDEIDWIYDVHYPKIETLLNAKYDLTEAEKAGDRNLILKKEADLKLAIEKVKNIPYEKIQEKLQKAIQYMIEHSISCPNPFINFYEASRSSYKFGKEAIEETNKQYDEKVWKIFYAGLSIYDIVMQLNIDALYSNPVTQAQGEELAKEFALFLNGDGTDKDVTSVAYATKYYQNVIDKKNKSINEYIYDVDKTAKFNDVAEAKVSSLGFFAVGDKKNVELLRFIDNNASYRKKNPNPNKCKEYFNAINNLITKQYMSGNNNKMTLRHFLEEKLDIKIPENCKYLVCGQNYNVSYQADGGVRVEGKIPLIKLDESRATIKDVHYTKGFIGDVNYYSNTLDDLCYFVPTCDTVSEKVAEITYRGETLDFSSIDEAWEFANEHNFCVVKLQSDWIAQKSVDDNFTSFGDGDPFTRSDNEKNYYGALYVRSTLTVDLNGYTIDRNQDVPVDDGSVFILDDVYPRLTIIDTSGSKGKITGGNTKGRGGAICDLTHGISGNSNITLENISITGNHAVEEGGGISYSCCSGSDELIIKNCDIVNNLSDKNGGGVFAEVSYLYSTKVTLDGTVNVTNNLVNGKTNNFTLDENVFVKSTLKFNPTFNINSRIGVNTTASANRIDFTEGNSNIKNYTSVFTSDSTSHKINIYKGTFSSKYYGELQKI